MKKFDTVIFDLGGVLVDWNPAYLNKTIFDDEKKMNDFFAEVCTSDWNEEQDGGRTIREATDELIGRFPEHEEYIRAYYNSWDEMQKGPIEGTVEILKELRDSKNVKLYALTNWSAETFPIALERYEFLHWFDGRLVSGEERIRKPFREIYELILNRFSINPETAVYIDDNQRNLHEPKELGIETIHFVSPEKLREDLRNFGVI